VLTHYYAPSEEERWDKKIASLSSADNSVWKMARSLKSPHRITPPLTTSEITASTDAEKAELFAIGLKSRFSNDLPSALEDDAETHWMYLRLCSMDRPSNTSASEIIEIIDKLKPKSPPGPDAISNKLLKNLPTPTIAFLSNLFNFLFHTSYFPTA
jgi:hypothetical protein